MRTIAQYYGTIARPAPSANAWNVGEPQTTPPRMFGDDRKAGMLVPQSSWRRKWPVVLAVLAVAGVAFTAARQPAATEPDASMLERQTNGAATTATTSTSPQPSLLSDNEHTRRTGRMIGDGLYTHHVVQVHKPTRFQLDSGEVARWYVDGTAVSVEDASDFEVELTTLGKHTVTAVTAEGARFEYAVHVKAIRYELRDLSHTDREMYFSALRDLYFTSQTDGEAKYGADFYSSDKLVKIHLEGAASRECDHWHDDAGILNHHVGITAKFEQSLRMIAPKTAAHYWDYTRDSAFLDSWADSEIFYDDWYGSNSPDNAAHVLDTGRFAYTAVMTDAYAFSNLTNPYGLMRSPWNTNPTPYLMRSNKTMGVYADANSEFPTCSAFAATVGDTLGDVLQSLNGALHGPVHIMIGGQWYEDNSQWHKVTETMEFPDSFLLLAKVLWRTGYLREPSYCSADTAVADCLTKCPEELRMSWTAAEFLNHTGMVDLMPDYEKTVETILANGLTLDDLVDEICHIGLPGEMFTSSAPQDPTFWPLHGNAERFVQLLRLLDSEGKVSFDQTWSYLFHSSTPSADGLSCDWSGVDPQSMDMPTCVHATCTGHASEDTLPFTGLFPDQEELYTNAEYYKLISPDNVDLPYAYDSVDYWKGCTNSSMYAEYLASEDAMLDFPDPNADPNANVPSTPEHVPLSPM